MPLSEVRGEKDVVNGKASRYRKDGVSCHS